jgi:hypothetical protein
MFLATRFQSGGVVIAGDFQVSGNLANIIDTLLIVLHLRAEAINLVVNLLMDIFREVLHG